MADKGRAKFLSEVADKLREAFLRVSIRGNTEHGAVVASQHTVMNRYAKRRPRSITSKNIMACVVREGSKHFLVSPDPDRGRHEAFLPYVLWDRHSHQVLRMTGLDGKIVSMV